MSGLGAPISGGIIIFSLLLVFISLSLKQMEISRRLEDEKEALEERREVIRSTFFNINSSSILTTTNSCSFLIKNEGRMPITAIAEMDLFSDVALQVSSNPFVYKTWIPYAFNSTVIAQGTFWNYSLLDTSYNTNFWDPEETLNVTIYLPTDFSAGTFYARLVGPIGCSDLFFWDVA